MAQRVESFSVTWNAGQTANFNLPFTRESEVDSIEILCPAGSNGLLKFSLRQAGQGIIPPNTGGLITAVGEVIKWPLEDFLNSNNWSIHGENSGIYQHSLYLRFLLREPAQQKPVFPLEFGPASLPIAL